MAHRSILDIMHDGGYSPMAGRPIPIELVYEANTITYDEYRAEVERQRRTSQAGRNEQNISAMEADAEALRQRAIRAGVPARYLDYAIDLTRIDDLRNGRGIYVYGTQGSYKTTTACSMLRGWLRDNPFGTARFIRATTLIDDFNDSYSTRETMAQVMGQHSSVGLLLVDDLGKEVPTPKVVSRLWELFDRRYGSGLPTIVTSQHAPGELLAHLSNGGSEAALAIISRFRETYALLDMGDVDHR